MLLAGKEKIAILSSQKKIIRGSVKKITWKKLQENLINKGKTLSCEERETGNEYFS